MDQVHKEGNHPFLLKKHQASSSYDVNRTRNRYCETQPIHHRITPLKIASTYRDHQKVLSKCKSSDRLKSEYGLIGFGQIILTNCISNKIMGKINVQWMRFFYETMTLYFMLMTYLNYPTRQLFEPQVLIIYAFHLLFGWWQC